MIPAIMCVGDSICSEKLDKFNNEKIGKVIGTKMSNQSLENSLNNLDIDFFREDVGDKNVLNKMLEENSILGGEPSGHIISLDIGGPTGDAIISSLAYLYYANILSSKNLLPKLKDKYIPKPTISTK